MRGSELSGNRVLVVDGDSQSRAHACRLIAQLGAQQVHEAASGRDAIALLEKDIHVILTEVDTDAISGIQLLQHIRSQPEPLKNIAVVILTSLSGKETVNLALKNGADGYVVKPVTEEALAAHCAAALRRAAMRKRRAAR